VIDGTIVCKIAEFLSYFIFLAKVCWAYRRARLCSMPLPKQTC